MSLLLALANWDKQKYPSSILYTNMQCPFQVLQNLPEHGLGKNINFNSFMQF